VIQKYAQNQSKMVCYYFTCSSKQSLVIPRLTKVQSFIMAFGDTSFTDTLTNTCKFLTTTLTGVRRRVLLIFTHWWAVASLRC